MKFNITLADVLVFITGAPAVPPLGFIPHPCINFHSSNFPRANTCINCLYLPLKKMTFNDFNYYILYGLVNSYGFGQV